MDRNSKIFFGVFGLLIAGSVGFTFYKIVILRDYIIQAEVECDPTMEKCFVYECSPGEDEDCPDNPEDPEERLSYYKLIRKKAAQITVCDPNHEECPELKCGLGEECMYELCDVATVEEGVTCVDPVEYVKDHPEEASTECEEGDESCTADAEKQDKAVCDPESEDECVSEDDGAEEAMCEGEDCAEETSVGETPADDASPDKPTSNAEETASPLPSEE